MSQNRAASRYAKSLLELAVEKGKLEDVQQDMKLFDKVCKENKNFTLMLKNPIIKHDKKKAVLNALFEGKVNDLTIALFGIITKKNRESILPALAVEFQNQYNTHKGIELAKVTTAVPLTKELRAKLEGIVKNISDRTSVELVEEIDKNIIGGFILKVGDRQIDDSIKTKLKALELEFSQNLYIKEF